MYNSRNTKCIGLKAILYQSAGRVDLLSVSLFEIVAGYDKHSKKAIRGMDNVLI